MPILNLKPRRGYRCDTRKDLICPAAVLQEMHYGTDGKLVHFQIIKRKKKLNFMEFFQEGCSTKDSSSLQITWPYGALRSHLAAMLFI